MMTYKLVTLVVLLLCLGVNSQSLVVDSDNGNDIPLCMSNNTMQSCKTIAYVFASINANATAHTYWGIKLVSSLYKGDGNCNLQLPHTSGVISSEVGSVIDCESKTPHFYATPVIPQGWINFDNVTFLNGYNPLDGGCINTLYRETLVEASTFINCVSDGNGGAFSAYNASGTIQIQNSNFINNKAGMNGGAIAAAIWPIIMDCEFTGNQAGVDTGNGNGGAVWAIYLSQISGSNFYSNTAAGGGGAAYVLQPGGTNIYRSVFYNNSADMGGALYLAQDDDRSTPQLTNLLFEQNSAERVGGGLKYDLAFGSFSHVTFLQNTAGQYGGGLFLGNATTPNVHDFTFMYFNVTQNSAPFPGAGVYATTHDVAGWYSWYQDSYIETYIYNNFVTANPSNTSASINDVSCSGEECTAFCGTKTCDDCFGVCVGNTTLTCLSGVSSKVLGCGQHGTCMWQNGGASTRCDCSDGFTGDLCVTGPKTNKSGLAKYKYYLIGGGVVVFVAIVVIVIIKVKQHRKHHHHHHKTEYTPILH